MSIFQHHRIYKYDTTGRLRVWFMESEDDRYRTVSGIDGGKLVTSEWTTAVPASKETGAEQALFEVSSNYDYNLAREYHLTALDAKAGPKFFKPMLAQKWQDVPWSKIQGEYVYSQPKLDGFCCIAQASGLTSREGRPIVSCPHIMDALTPLFETKPYAVLHGELYNHELKHEFGQLSSILKKQTPTRAELALSRSKIEFHVYDYPCSEPTPENLGYVTRHTRLSEDTSGLEYIYTVSTETVRRGDDQTLTRLASEYLEQGYEGQMIRQDLPYEQKRSKSVLKNKEFDDHEFEVIEIQEGKGNWSGVAKSVLCRMPDGRTFGAGIRGTWSQMKQLLSETHKQVTIRHFGYTPDGIPRMGVATAWHGEGRVL